MKGVWEFVQEHDMPVAQLVQQTSGQDDQKFPLCKKELKKDGIIHYAQTMYRPLPVTMNFTFTLKSWRNT
jgi:hypothetical protein